MKATQEIDAVIRQLGEGARRGLLCARPDHLEPVAVLALPEWARLRVQRAEKEKAA